MSKQVPLTEIPEGSSACVVEIAGGTGVHDRLRALGIRAGVQVTKVSDSFASGPIVVRHGQTQTALGRGICRKIVVEATK
ncbi:MAG: ferrous iron transport protein A [Nitrospiraceae bacterium]|nr:ferrous iron transport protein A [Nitrospiraceae bacterium]